MNRLSPSAAIGVLFVIVVLLGAVVSAGHS